MSSKQTNNKTFEKRSIYRHDDSGKVFLACLIIPLAISILISVIIAQIANQHDIEPTEITSNMWFLTGYAILNFIIYISIYLIYNKVCKIEYKAVNLKFKMPWHTYLIIIAVGIISLFGIQYFIGAVDNLLALIGFPLQEGTSINPTDFGTFMLAVFVLALLPAIAEELIFRGIIFNGLRTKFNETGAILISAIMFSLMHGSFQQFVYPFILGSIMAWLVIRTGSIFSSMLVHFINNFLVVMFAYIQNATGWSMDLPREWWFYLLAFALLFVTASILILIDKYYFKHKSKEQSEIQKGRTSPYIFVSIVVAVIILIIKTIVSFA